MSRLSSYLGRAVGKSAVDESEIDRLARAAWHARGVAMIRLEDIHDPWERQTIVNVASRFYGRRAETP